MKKLSMFMGKLALLMLGVCFFAACSDDDSPSYSTASVQNTELLSVLKDAKYGLTFNENGNLLLDDAAKNTTKLDLSGTKISQSALSELTILPNLTEVDLSNNGYGPVFHVDSLPTQITGLDLKGNEIYDFEGLVNASVVNDEVQATVLHPFTKLYLPASCKYNVEDLMPFYTQNQTDGNTVDMQMVGDNGALSAYNTLREIPDQYFRAYLKTKFASLFADETHIDISKPMKVTEQGEPIVLWYKNAFADIAEIASIEGVEYFINNPFYKAFYVSIGDYANTNLFTVGYLMPRANIKSITIENAESPNGFDFSKATALASFAWKNNPYLYNLDLSNTLLGKQDVNEIESSIGNGLSVVNCKNLQKIILPSSSKGIIHEITLQDLPLLENINMSKFEAMGILTLLNLPKCSIEYPVLKKFFSLAYKELYDFNEDEGWQVGFSISEDVYNKNETQDFIKTYNDGLWDRYWKFRKQGAYNWKK